MAKPERINEENFLTVDMDEVVRDQRFKDLNFTSLRLKLSRIQKWIQELETYEYQAILGREELQRLTHLKRDFIRRLEELNTFEIRTTNDTASQELANATNQVEAVYDQASQIMTRVLTFLRLETARTSADTEELEKQQKAAAQAESEYRELFAKLKTDLADLEKRKNEVASSQGEVAAIGLGKHFEAQADEYREQAEMWLSARFAAFFSLTGVIAINFVLYFSLFITTKIGTWPYIQPGDFFTLEYGLLKIALIALLSYAISFASRNYNICAGLTANNVHRKNVAETLLNALGSPIEEAAKAQLMATAADAMFKHLSVGYIKKENQSDAGPLGEFLRRLSGSKD